MKTQEMTPSTLLFPNDGNCFQIPPFQRPYVWDLDRVHRLVQDINKAALTTNENGHWLGVILLAESDRPCKLTKQLGHNCWDILDGQQRSLSLRLWLIALQDEYQRQTDESMPAISRDRLTDVNVHSLNQKQWGIIRDYEKLILQKDPYQKSNNSNAVLRTYWYFRWLLLNGLSGFEGEEHLSAPAKPRSSKNSESEDLPVINFWISKNKDIKPLEPEYLSSLAETTALRLTIAAMKHEKKEDEPVEEIFETLNAERTELGQFDLARNFLFITLQTAGSQQQQVYDEYFFEAEQKLRNANLDTRGESLDSFLYDYLISTGKFDEGIGRSNTAASLKAKWHVINKQQNPMKFLTEQLTPAMYAWLAIRSGSEFIKDVDEFELGPEVARQLMRIESFSKGPFVPITLRILLSWMQSKNSSVDKIKSELHLVETYIVRSLLSGVPFSPMRRLMTRLCYIIENDMTTLEDWVRTNSPSDDRLIQVLTQSCAENGKERPPVSWVLQDDLGDRTDSRALSAIFDGLSEHLEGNQGKSVVKKPNTRNKAGAKNSFWVEHFYPQKPEKWAVDLELWNVPHEYMGNRLNSLGNLSILSDSANKTMSNKSLKDKQSDYRNIKLPSFKLNYDFMNCQQWTHVEIDQRTRDLTNSAIQFWKLPSSHLDL